MAGDWIKMTHALPEKPEVLAIAGRTGLNRFEVVGRLFTMWRWFDINTINGNAASVTSLTLDACLFGYGCVTNFVSAVVECGWLRETPSGLEVVNFEAHISESAKKRALTAVRVKNHKSKESGNASANGEVTLAALPNEYHRVTKSVPREEKRREEKREEKNTHAPREVVADATPKKSKTDWLTVLIQEGVAEDVASDWLRVRKEKRAPLTTTALDGIRREAAAAGMTFPQAIRVAAESGWQGFKAEWLKPNGTGGKGAATSFKKSDDDRLAERVREMTGGIVSPSNHGEVIEMEALHGFRRIEAPR